MAAAQNHPIHTIQDARAAGSRPRELTPNRIFVDCTLTVRSGLRTGVQRVVRSLVREGIQIGEERGQAILGVALGNSGFEKCQPVSDSEELIPPPAPLLDDLMHYMPPTYTRAAEWLCRNFPSPRIRHWLLPQPGHYGIFKVAIELMNGVEKLAGQNTPGINELGIAKGDVLILADSYWGKPRIWKHVRAVRERGAFVVVVLHDIIPITHPQFVPRRTPEIFRNYLLQAVSNADLIVAVSQTICDQLRTALPKIFPQRKAFPPIESFRNGADFTANQDGTVREALDKLFDRNNAATPYLSVSTFDPRKNHRFTLEAFETLWARGLDARLMFIGSRGWKSEDLLHKIETHPRLGTKLFLYHDLTDAELFHCYQHARGTISSSCVEGFGLPIVESLWHGRKTFASDTPVHREVGGEHATYFDLASPQNLAAAIVCWEAELARGAALRHPNVRPMNWRESTALLLERSLTAYAVANSPTAPSATEEMIYPAGIVRAA